MGGICSCDPKARATTNEYLMEPTRGTKTDQTYPKSEIAHFSWQILSFLFWGTFLLFIILKKNAKAIALIFSIFLVELAYIWQKKRQKVCARGLSWIKRL